MPRRSSRRFSRHYALGWLLVLGLGPGLAAHTIGAWATGWRAVAARYPDHPMRVEGALEGRLTAAIGRLLGLRSGSARIDVGDRGLRFTPTSFGSFVYPTFLVPWPALERCEAARRWGVRIGVVGVSRDLAVRLGDAAALLRACQAHRAGGGAPAA